MFSLPTTLLYSGEHHDLSVNSEYFLITSKCCSGSLFWSKSRPGMTVCSLCGDEKTIGPLGRTYYSVVLSKESATIFNLWVSSWFPNIEVVFDE